MSITMIILQHTLPAECLGYWVRVPLQPYLSDFASFYTLLESLNPGAELC